MTHYLQTRLLWVVGLWAPTPSAPAPSAPAPAQAPMAILVNKTGPIERDFSENLMFNIYALNKKIK